MFAPASLPANPDAIAAPQPGVIRPGAAPLAGLARSRTGGG